MLITKRGEVTKQGFCKILGRKLRPRGSLLLEFSKKNGMGREVIPTLTTFSANSARRLDPQDRIPITSYWTSQIGLFWCWIRQKLKFTMLSPPFRHFFLSSIYGWPLETTMIMVKRLLPVIEVIFDCPLFLIKKTLFI